MLNQVQKPVSFEMLSPADFGPMPESVSMVCQLVLY
jgi:hypothetical protein